MKRPCGEGFCPNHRDNRGSQRAGGALAGYVTTHTRESDRSGRFEPIVTCNGHTSPEVRNGGTCQLRRSGSNPGGDRPILIGRSTSSRGASLPGRWCWSSLFWNRGAKLQRCRQRARFCDRYRAAPVGVPRIAGSVGFGLNRPTRKRERTGTRLPGDDLPSPVVRRHRECFVHRRFLADVGQRKDVVVALRD